MTIFWCPRCGEEQWPSDVGRRLVVCWCCSEVILTVAYDDDIDYVDLVEHVGG